MCCQLHYKKYGNQGPVVVILHGLFGMLDNWSSLARQLSTNCQVFIVDQRNHGRSCHKDEMDFGLMSADVNLFFKTHHLNKVNLIGHSMGGKVAMWLALNHPEKVASLMVIDIAPKEYAPNHLPIFEALLSVDLSQKLTRNQIATQLTQKIPNLSIVQFLMKNLGRNDQMDLVWKMNLPAIYTAYQKVNSWPNTTNMVFSGRTLFVKGTKSKYIQPFDYANILKQFPQGKIIQINQAGHWVHAEQPQKLLEQIRDFVNKD